MSRLAVVGGGWAGLAAAVELRRAAPHADIHLFEAASEFGGRARGLEWQSPQGRVPIDHGQHLVLGAHRAFLRLLDDCRAACSQDPGSTHAFVWRCQESALHFGRSAAPWGLIEGGIQTLADQIRGKSGGWPWAWQAAMLRLLWTAQQRRWTTSGTVSELLESLGQPQGLIEALWQPMAESALNTGITEAPAAIFLELLRRTVAGPRDSLAIWHPQENLSTAAVAPVVAWLRARGVGLHPRSRRRVAELRAAGFSGAVMAISPRHRPHTLADLAPGAAVPRPLPEPRWRGILTLFLLRPTGCEDPGRIDIVHPAGVGNIPLVRLHRPPGPWGQVEAWVASALPSRERPEAVADIRAQLRALALQRLKSDGLSAEYLFEHHDPLATWACDNDGTQRPWRLPLPTNDGSMALRWAGDDGAEGLPATIESAVLSGQAAARALLSAMG